LPKTSRRVYPGARPRIDEGEANLLATIAEEIRPSNPNIEARALQRDPRRRPSTRAISHPTKRSNRARTVRVGAARGARRRAGPRLFGYKISAPSCGRRCARASRPGGGGVASRWPCGDHRRSARALIDGPPAAGVMVGRGAGRPGRDGPRRSRPSSRQGSRQRGRGCRQRRPGGRGGRSTPIQGRPPLSFVHGRRAQGAAQETRPAAVHHVGSCRQEGSEARLPLAQSGTVGLAQRLYEKGVEVGGGRASFGFSYTVHGVRLDPSVSDDAVTEGARITAASASAPIAWTAGPVVYQTKKGAQDGTRAIRPKSVQVRPRDLSFFVRQALGGRGEGGGARTERETGTTILRLYTSSGTARSPVRWCRPCSMFRPGIEIGTRGGGVGGCAPAGAGHEVALPRASTPRHRRGCGQRGRERAAALPQPSREGRERLKLLGNAAEQALHAAGRRASPRRRSSRSSRRRGIAARRRPRGRSSRRSQAAAHV